MSAAEMVAEMAVAEGVQEEAMMVVVVTGEDPVVVEKEAEVMDLEVRVAMMAAAMGRAAMEGGGV